MPILYGIVDWPGHLWTLELRVRFLDQKVST
jgi:hypothetical protein